MGVGNSQQNYQSPNLIMDFHFRLFKPTATPMVHAERGPASSEMHQDIAEEMQLTIHKLIDSGDNYNKSMYRQVWS